MASLAKGGAAAIVAAAVALSAPAFLLGGCAERVAQRVDNHAETEERRRAERDDLQRSRDEHRERMREGP